MWLTELYYWLVKTSFYRTLDNRISPNVVCEVSELFKVQQSLGLFTLSGCSTSTPAATLLDDNENACVLYIILKHACWVETKSRLHEEIR